MRFRKYHGAGNDFVMVADLDSRLGPNASLPKELVAALCDRHTGVGGDGLIRIVRGGEGAAYYMDYYNADGSAAEMCGNGIRCLVLHEIDAGRLDEGEHVIGTKAGNVAIKTLGRGRVTADMGVPTFGRSQTVHDGETLQGMTVDMGNPHLVLFCDEIGRSLDDATVHGLGRQLEHHPDFPQATNVEFVVVESATHLRMRVWERGVGETLACGSGACAVGVAAAALERSGPHVLIDLPGGELEVEWEPGGHVWLTGPAEFVFEGEIEQRWLAARDLAHHAELVA
jgi:diaminopimelate epimerase